MIKEDKRDFKACRLVPFNEQKDKIVSDISNDATPEAVDNAMNEALSADAPQGGDAPSEGASVAAEGPSEGAPAAAAPAGKSPSVNAASGGAAPSMAGDATMQALTGMSMKGKKAALSTGIAGKAASFMGAAASPATGGAMAVAQLAFAVAHGMFLSKYEVKTTGNAVHASKWAKGSGKQKTNGKILEKGQPLSMKKPSAGVAQKYPRGTSGAKADAVLGASPSSKVSASIKSNVKSQSLTSPSIFRNKRKEAILARVQHVKQSGFSAVHKDGKGATKAGQSAKSNNTFGINKNAAPHIQMHLMRKRNPFALNM